MQHDSGLPDLAHAMFSEKVGLAVAAGMVSSPYWLQYVKVVSDVAAIFAPILGCCYLLLQIGFKLVDRFGGKDGKDG